MRTDEEKVKDEVRKIAGKFRRAVVEPWKGQAFGSIDYQQQSAIVTCPICTIKADTGRPVGVRRKDQKRHMADHKAGLI